MRYSVKVLVRVAHQEGVIDSPHHRVQEEAVGKGREGQAATRSEHCDFETRLMVTEIPQTLDP